MGNPKGFLEIKRKEAGYRPVRDRIGDFGEVEQTLNLEDRIDQAARCMDCGIPFCHWACPTASKIPEWQDAIYRENWEEAAQILQSTNSFPEFTGRVCPAPCEKSCVLSLHNSPVTIRENEASVIEKSFDYGYIKARPVSNRTGKKVAVIGSGPAGLSVADLLNQAGHKVTVFERDDAIGGLLRYGIPDFKLDKHVIDRRLELFVEEGIEFRTKQDVGVNVSFSDLEKEYDAICLAIGAMKPRDLPIEGRDLNGIYFAMDFLKQQNKVVRGDEFSKEERISAKGKNVVVIGGGDTGSDCVGTSVRQKAKSVLQIELLPKPPEEREENNPWPYWPDTLRTSSSHLEGCKRRWSLSSKQFNGVDGNVSELEIVQVEWKRDSQAEFKMKEVPGSEEKIEADLVLLAMGFVHPIHEGLVTELGLELDPRGNIKTNKQGQTSNPKVFCCGDATSGASLVVRAIDSGRKTASSIHKQLMK
ncbi:glutamate synthase subunit beta [Marinifilum caeruleilacunae]|uniref:Glutamate synthase subunit beta n=1 Tax=Marinifilum caeruleilacunae TaxID=2499076 RepID=A0ABX1WQ48_9BACT|nr:glutamate synthase small subunit [Marinifilum caeruleilacunae]NOU58188.1 glutamate synthase subunit beta [Marinifilum caeruleilacunae]